MGGHTRHGVAGWAAAATFGVAVLSGCATESASGPVASVTSTSVGTASAMAPGLSGGSEEFDCSNPIGDSPPEPGRTVVLSVVALPAHGPAAPLQAAADGDGGYFAKNGLGVRAGQGWELRVPAAAREHLRIGWGSPAQPTFSTRTTGCTGSTSTGWLWFPGGYWVDRPGCYPLDVLANGRTERITLAIGAACPEDASPATG